jgi:two-component system, NtrC family, nitrogen regulation response regulator NtrX
VAHFAAGLTRRGGLPAKEFEAAAVQRLTAHDWPGNIRELRNAVERLLILAPGAKIVESDVERIVDVGGGRRRAAEDGGQPDWVRAGTFEDFKQAAERAFLVAKLQEHDWNVSETARTLQMPRSNLYKKIERYGLAREGGV